MTKATLQAGDYVFISSGGQRILVEEKRPNDLISSWSSRRLQKQLRKALQVADVVVLAVRGSEYGMAMVPQDLWRDLLKAQLLGVIVTFLPERFEDVLQELRRWKAFINSESRSVLSIVSGTDKTRESEGLTPCALALTRLFKGRRLGRTTAISIANTFGNDLVQCLTATDKAWLDVPGVGKTLLNARKEVLNADT